MCEGRVSCESESRQVSQTTARFSKRWVNWRLGLLLMHALNDMRLTVSGWMSLLLPVALQHGVCIITNMGASKYAPEPTCCIVTKKSAS